MQRLLAGWVFCASLLAGCDNTGTPPTPNRQSAGEPVFTQPVRWQTRTRVVEAVGTSRARRSVVLYPRVSGVVDEVHFAAGDFVEAGKTLLELDDREQRLALELAKVDLADAQRLMSRYRESQAAGGITEAMIDEAASAVDQAEIALERARVLLDYHTVKAPFAGYVGLTELDPGARIDTDTPVASIDDRRELWVAFAVPEQFYGQLALGDAVTVSTWTHGSPTRQAQVRDIDSRVGEQSRNFTVRATLANEGDRLRPGMSFRVRLSLADGRYPVVPEVALLWGGDGAYVWGVSDAKATRIPVTVVQRQKGQILVDADLPEGSHVVSEGVQQMREGLAIRDVMDEIQEAMR